MISKIIFLDNIKSKVMIVYFVLLALFAWVSLLLQDSETKSALTILNIQLFIIPLMSLLYSVIYIYDSREFITLLLSQPLRRRQVWQSLYVGVAGCLLIVYLLAAGLPMLLYTGYTSILLLLTGCAITLISTSVAFLIAMLTSEKTRGIGLALILWLLLTIIYDALLLYVLFIFADYPVDTPIMGLLMLNPLDLVRFQVIMQMDASAMMGYSGAMFKEVFGATGGIIVSALLLLLWIVVPYLLSLRIFKRKDL